MNNNRFSEQTAITIIKDSDNEFPVPFDGLWQWVGYNQKSDAKSMLISNFEENTDYRFSGKSLKTPQGGRPSQVIMLTVDAAKSFCLMAQTAQGREVRKYFIAAERKARELLKALANRSALEERAKARLDVVETNKQVTKLVKEYGGSYGKLHNDRYTGLYGRTAVELKQECGAKKRETPLNYMSKGDLALQQVVNIKAIEHGDPDLVYAISKNISEGLEKATGKKLNPNWETNRLSPDQARENKPALKQSNILQSLFPDYQ